MINEIKINDLEHLKQIIACFEKDHKEQFLYIGERGICFCHLIYDDYFSASIINVSKQDNISWKKTKQKILSVYEKEKDTQTKIAKEEEIIYILVKRLSGKDATDMQIGQIFMLIEQHISTLTDSEIEALNNRYNCFLNINKNNPKNILGMWSNRMKEYQEYKATQLKGG